ncbi:MAG: alpha/beta hydrolase, partial [Actinomycetota bacterium]|nr:alpha/beta hydrolase [Actinomycetota bacterium]
LQNPQKVRQLALISPVGARMHASLRRSNPKLAHQLLSSPLAFLFRPLLRYGLQKFGFPRGLRDEAILNAMWFNSLIDYGCYTTMLHQVNQPTLILYAKDDAIIESIIFEELLDIIPQVNSIVFERGGHNPQKYHAEAIASSLINLINNESPPPRSPISQ